MFFFFVFFIVTLNFYKSEADTPANCTFDDVVGNWIFYESERGHSSSIDCSDPSNFYSYYIVGYVDSISV